MQANKTCALLKRNRDKYICERKAKKNALLSFFSISVNQRTKEGKKKKYYMPTSTLQSTHDLFSSLFKKNNI